MIYVEFQKFRMKAYILQNDFHLRILLVTKALEELVSFLYSHTSVLHSAKQSDMQFYQNSTEMKPNQIVPTFLLHPKLWGFWHLYYLKGLESINTVSTAVYRMQSI